MVAKSAAASAKNSTPTTGSLASSSGSQKRFKGVRMRSWGKWVSEIRLPNTRARLWLGSYTTAEQAARAFDVAVVCLRGSSSTLNFPDSPPAYAPLGLPHHQIQELAAAAAAAAAAASSPSSSATSSSLEPTTPLDLRADSATQVDSPTSAASDESEPLSWDQCSRLWATSAETEAATTDMRLRCGQCSSLSSTSAGSGESEAATTNEMNSSSSSSCCSSPVSTAHNSGSIEELLLLDDEQSSPLTSSPFAALQYQEQALNCVGSEWEELLWGVSISSYSPWDQLLPPLPCDDDLPAMMEPCLWSL